MSYQKFAYFYDYLMKDAPYDEWVEFVNRIVQKYKVDGHRFLDVGCGTGELAIRLQNNGYDMTGVDLSEEMVGVAIEKANQSNLPIPFYQQDMRELDGLGEFDLAMVFCDSLNYLLDQKDIIQTFTSVHHHVKENGLFLFDVHSVYKMVTFFEDSTYADNEDDVSYIWHAWKGEMPYSVEHELTFFAHDQETGQYSRYDEDHFQRTYPVEMYQNWIEMSGFELLEVLGDFGEKSTDQADRIFFVCRKK